MKLMHNCPRAGHCRRRDCLPFKAIMLTGFRFLLLFWVVSANDDADAPFAFKKRTKEDRYSLGRPELDRNKDPPRAVQEQKGWDVKLQDIEQKLESDLKRVEQDAASVDYLPQQDATGKRNATSTTRRKHHLKDRPPASNDKNNKTSSIQLAQDLSVVRNDIEDLVKNVKQAEEELERAKAKVDREEKVVKLRSAEVETEKILDDLHRGKLNVKVDYVTGKLVAGSPKEPVDTKLAQQTRRSIQRDDNNSTLDSGVETEVSLGDKTGGTGDVEAVAVGDTIDAKLESAANGEAEAVSEEKVLEEIIDASIRKTASMDTPVQDENVQTKVDQGSASENVKQRIELDPNLKSRVREEIESLRSGADPAVMSMDMQLLLDIVQLAITASLFGLAAVFLRLPPTAGFLLGGMLIGPSCWNVIGEIHQVQTLAQFGSVFLLFEQGLLYSQTYSGAAVLGSALATGRIDELPESSPKMKSDSTVLSRRGGAGKKSKSSPTTSSSSSRSTTVDTEHDPNIVGSIVLILLVFSCLAIVVLTDAVSSVPEAIFVSCSIAVCSSTIVSENLHAAHIANTTWGKGVLKMIAIQDIFMVPLLALPEIIAPLYEYETKNLVADDDETEEPEWLNMSNLIWHLILIAVFLKGSMVLARHIVSAASLAQARMMGEKGELFTLSIVAYALLIATTSEQLKLSIEAGAVVAGIALWKSPYVPKVLASIQPITSVFGGMYMTSLGMILSPTFVMNEAWPIIELVCLIGVFKLVLVSTVLNRCFDHGITASLAVGSAMAQVSEASLLVLAKAQRLGLVSRKTYLMLIPTTCIMLTLAPLSAAHLRRLKMQEVSGSDDGRIPYYLCFLRHLRILRQHHRPNIPLHNSHELEEARDFST